MKKETIACLSKELKTGKLLTPDDIDRLFDIYILSEIHTLDDLYNMGDDFFKFVKSNLDNFSFESPDDKIFITSIAFLKLKGYKMFFDRFSKDKKLHQETFAKEVGALVGGDKSVKILEVGSGEVPYSSMLLGSGGYNITSMDNFCVPTECLARFNVKSFRQMFKASTSVKEFDVVVGRRPCSAIYDIVQKCTAQNTPYFLRLCDCSAPNGTIDSWHPVLSAIDENVSYKNDYAYNLKGSDFGDKSKIEEIIEMDKEIIY